jgi:hypothetical protein
MAVWLNYRRERLRSKRREQLMIQGLQQATTEWQGLNRGFVSGRQLEMEILLTNVKTAADALVAALAAEAELGALLCESDGKDPSLRLQWEASRRTGEQAHEVYNEGIQEYREFVQSLAPPLRLQAAQRGYQVMTIARA